MCAVGVVCLHSYSLNGRGEEEQRKRGRERGWEEGGEGEMLARFLPDLRNFAEPLSI